MGKLDGKVAIVTGGGRGIGCAIAEAYAREEAEAFVSVWGPERALAIVADVTDSAACERVVAETSARFGQLDVLVNNVGRRLVATEWSPQHADVRPAAGGIDA